MKRYPISPFPKPRPRRSSRHGKIHTYTPPAYKKFKADCQRLLMSCTETPVFVFWIPMPPSWSKKKKREMFGTPHRQTPDLDNLEKAVLDAIFSDDSKVWAMLAYKYWGYDGAIDIDSLSEQASPELHPDIKEQP